MSNNKKLADIIYLVGQPLLLNVIGVPATAYFIRTLGPSGWGQWTLATSLMATMAIIANLGLRSRFVRSIAQFPENAPTALAEQMGLRMLLSLAAGLLTVILCLILKYPTIVLYCVIVTALGFLMSSVATVLGDLLQGFGNFKQFSSVNFTAGIIVTAVTVVAIWQGAGPLGLSIAYLSGPAVTLMLWAILVHRRFFPVRVIWDFKRYWALLFDVRAMGLQQLLGTLQDRIEQLLLPKMVGIHGFGLFSGGTILASRLTVFPDGVATAYYPRIAEKYHTDKQEMAQSVAEMISLAMIICLPIAFLIAFLAPPIAAILFPKNIAACQTVIEITIWSIPLMGLSVPMVYALQAADKHTEAARIGMISTLCGCLLSFFLVWRYGIIGACWSLILRSALQPTLLSARFFKTFPSVLAHLFFGRICVCAGAMGLLLWFFRSYFHFSPWMLVLIALLSLIIYAVALIVFRVIKISQITEAFRRFK